MAWPPEIARLSVPGIDSMRTAAPCRFATASTAASFAPVTVLSTSTTTWLVIGSTDHAVPVIRADASRSAVTTASCAT